MKAIQFNVTIQRYAIGLILKKLYEPLLWSGISCTYSAQVPEPRLPGPEWTVLRTRYGGICGSDLSAIHLHTSPYYSPFSSFPYTFGHENCASIAQVGDQAGEWAEGERVVVEPLLWCKPRGFADLCRYCARGEINRCARHTDGNLAAGLMTGACRDTGGSWGEYFLAHRSQLYRLPDSISDENAVMIEPFAVGLHAALQNFPNDDECVLLVGAGTIGLCTLAALRALGSKAEILALARYPFQAQAAERLGASKVIRSNGQETYEKLAAHTGARLLRPIIGKTVVYGGVDRTFECVGSDVALDDALRLTRGGGRVALVGLPGIAKSIDWTAIMAKELEVRASFYYHHNEHFQGERLRTYDLAIRLMAQGEVDLSWMITQRYPLDDYMQALKTLSSRATSQAIRAVFAFPPN